MKNEEDKVYGPYPLPEIIVTPKGGYTNLKDYYLSVPGEIYDRNPILFRKAIRFMQRNRDLKGEAHIFNKCVSVATNRVAREFVLPVLLGVATMPIILEGAPIVYAIYKQPVVWARMGVNWTTQTMAEGIDKVDYVSVVAEGFTVGGSALSALIEFRPAVKEGPKWKKGFIDKSFEDTSVDIVVRALGAVSFNFASGMIMDDVKDIAGKVLLGGFGSLGYSVYQLASMGITEEIKDNMKIDDEE